MINYNCECPVDNLMKYYSRNWMLYVRINQLPCGSEGPGYVLQLLFSEKLQNS